MMKQDFTIFYNFLNNSINRLFFFFPIHSYDSFSPYVFLFIQIIVGFCIHFVCHVHIFVFFVCLFGFIKHVDTLSLTKKNEFSYNRENTSTKRILTLRQLCFVLLVFWKCLFMSHCLITFALIQISRAKIWTLDKSQGLVSLY